MSSNNFKANIPSIQEIDNYLHKNNLPSGREVRSKINDLLHQVRCGSTSTRTDIPATRESILEWLAKQLQRLLQNQTQALINATGTIIHTNLGRSVFSKELLQEAHEKLVSYSNLEFSMTTGKRGKRSLKIPEYIQTLTGAEDAIVVNNNAAAVLLVLTVLAKNGDVVISRGELVEIGGSFRIPEIIALSGALVKEVGTTNRTNIRDYENALTDDTKVILKVHPSNFEIVGFSESVNEQTLAVLGRKYDKIFIHDLGSGALTPFTYSNLNDEPIVSQSIKNGTDLVTFSADKLMGGPQAGIIAGRKDLVDQIKAHPLFRTMRCGKVTLTLLEVTLLSYIRNSHRTRVPTQRMLNESTNTVKERCEQLLDGLDPTIFIKKKCYSTPGGGSLPGKQIPSWGIFVDLREKNEDDFLSYLRAQQPPIIARIEKGQVILDCRTIFPKQIKPIQRILKQWSRKN